MKDSINSVIKQPLLHFILIGAMLFGLYYVVNPKSNDKDTIAITDEGVNRTVLVFEKEWNRAPSATELKSLIDKQIQQEVYYRKAMSMNLDENDELVRRRLEQKLRFLTNDLATVQEPSDEDLKAYYKKNISKYLLPKQYTFSHIYFSSDSRKNAQQDAIAVLPTLPNSDHNLDKLIAKGDAFPFSSHIENLSEKEIDQSMGDGFSASLNKVPLKKWSGPIQSGFGTHLIYINAISGQKEPDFAQIKQDLIRDFQYNAQEIYNQELYKQFISDYKIKLDVKDSNAYKKVLSQMFAINDYK